jgi:Zn-dependent protease with chaperone function
MVSALAAAQASPPASALVQPENRPPCASGKAYCLPPEKADKAATLGSIRTAIDLGSQFWGLAVLLLLLASGVAAKLAQRIQARTPRGWMQGLLFSLAIVSILFAVAQLPVLAMAHAASLHYRISVQGWGSWLLDEIKGWGLSLALEAPLLTLVYGLMNWKWSRKLPWAWFSLFAIPLMILGVFLLPALIEPLFDTFEPLAKSHPALVAQLERVVARTGTHIPPERMFLMKASEKSNGLNAYVTGIGASKRIVVWDTTADRMPQDEILFTFAHESGHYVLNHIPKGLTIAAIGMFPFFFLVVWLAEWLARRFGSVWHIATVAALPGLVVLLAAFSILQIITEPAMNTMSRHFEHEADVYGQESVHGIVADPQKTAVNAFRDLGEAYLDDPEPNPLLEFWTYDHPSIQTRATYAAHYDPWVPEGKPAFFPK